MKEILIIASPIKVGQDFLDSLLRNHVFTTKNDEVKVFSQYKKTVGEYNFRVISPNSTLRGYMCDKIYIQREMEHMGRILDAAIPMVNGNVEYFSKWDNWNEGGVK